MNQELGTVVCEHCGYDIPMSNVVIHNIHCLRNNVVCPKCSKRVRRYDLQEHNDKMHSSTQCNACDEKMETYLLPEHKLKCPKRLVACKFCEIEISQKIIPDHENYCGSRTEKCSDCGEYVMLKYKSLHLDSNHGFLKLEDEKKEVKKIPSPMSKSSNAYRSRNSSDDVKRAMNPLPQPRDNSANTFSSFNLPSPTKRPFESIGNNIMNLVPSSILDSIPTEDPLNNEFTNLNSRLNESINQQDDSALTNLKTPAKPMKLELQNKERGESWLHSPSYQNLDDLCDQALTFTSREYIPPTLAKPLSSRNTKSNSPNEEARGYTPPTLDDFLGNDRTIEQRFEMLFGKSDIQEPFNESQSAASNTKLNRKGRHGDLYVEKRIKPKPNLVDHLPILPNIKSISPPGSSHNNSQYPQNDSIKLPCEFCSELFPEEYLIQHQTGCRPDLTRLDNSIQIPCEFCNKSFSETILLNHQSTCIFKSF